MHKFHREPGRPVAGEPVGAQVQQVFLHFIFHVRQRLGFLLRIEVFVLVPVVILGNLVVGERRAQAQAAQEVFQGLPVRAAFGGGMCMFAYYSELPYLVEPNGLTQYWIAEQPLPTRGPKVGHEKLVSREQLLAHGVSLIFHHDHPPLQDRSPGLNRLIIDDALMVEMLTYDDALMDKLRATGRVRFRAIDDILRTATVDIQAMPCADAREAFAGLSGYYLDAHPDKAGPLREAMARACAR